MIKTTLPSKAKDIIIQEAIQRDITTARRITSLDILWHERYLTRNQLIARVELRLGKTALDLPRGRILSIATCAS